MLISEIMKAIDEMIAKYGHYPEPEDIEIEYLCEVKPWDYEVATEIRAEIRAEEDR